MSRPDDPKPVPPELAPAEAAADAREREAITNLLRAVFRGDVATHAGCKGGVRRKRRNKKRPPKPQE